MDLKQLLALVTVAELGSVTAAARVLHLVQPAVSRQIRSLEHELGAELFNRTRTGMVPTEIGRDFIARAKRALAELDRAEALARRDGNAIAGTVTVGLLESVVGQLAIPLADAVHEAYPDVELHIISGYSGHLSDWLASGEVDMSLRYSRASEPGAGSALEAPLVRESLWAVAPTSAGLTPDVPIRWSRLSDEGVVLPVVGHGLRALIDLGLAESGASPTVVLETNSLELQKAFVQRGRGWTVLPAVGVARDVAAGRVSAAPLSEPAVARTVTLALARARSTPVVGAVANELVATVVELVRNGAWPGTLAKPAPGHRPSDVVPQL